MSASLPVPAKEGTLPAAPSTTNTAIRALSYSQVAARAPFVTSRLQPVSLGSRPATHIDNILAIMQTEEEQLRKQRENTLIMKFTAGHSSLYDIR